MSENLVGKLPPSGRSASTSRSRFLAKIWSVHQSINTLFRLRGFPVPVALSNKNNMCTRLIDALENEEVIAKQRNPITNEMFASMEKLAQESPKDSAISTIFDFFCLIQIVSI
jgi:hypothetical protein